MRLSKLPYWLRRIIAWWLSEREGEYGGGLMKWRPDGKHETLCKWKTDKGLEESWAIIQNMHDSGRDEIYIALAVQGRERGYLCIHAQGRHRIVIYFWDDIVTFDEACEILKKRCAEIRKKMGYGVPKYTGDGEP